MTDSVKCIIVPGIEVVDGSDGSVTMCQRRYVNVILKLFWHERVQGYYKWT